MACAIYNQASPTPICSPNRNLQSKCSRCQELNSKPWFYNQVPRTNSVSLQKFLKYISVYFLVVYTNWGSQIDFYVYESVILSTRRFVHDLTKLQETWSWFCTSNHILWLWPFSINSTLNSFSLHAFKANVFLFIHFVPHSIPNIFGVWPC